LCHSRTQSTAHQHMHHPTNTVFIVDLNTSVVCARVNGYKNCQQIDIPARVCCLLFRISNVEPNASIFRIQTFVQGLLELSTIANRKQFYIGLWQ
jgi:hypothetical protein